jgi:hypothetical protein
VAVYLYHAETRVCPTSATIHYVGSTPDGSVAQRDRQHRSGGGAKLTRAWIENGVQFRYGRLWSDDELPVQFGGNHRAFEEAVKAYAKTAAFCAACSASPKDGSTLTPKGGSYWRRQAKKHGRYRARAGE